jgi:hypothetical protein
VQHVESVKCRRKLDLQKGCGVFYSLTLLKSAGTWTGDSLILNLGAQWISEDANSKASESQTRGLFTSSPHPQIWTVTSSSSGIENISIQVQKGKKILTDQQKQLCDLVSSLSSLQTWGLQVC